MTTHPETVGTHPHLCQMCNGTPRWELVRQGDVIVTWACEDHLVMVIDDLLPTEKHRHQAMVTDLANTWEPPASTDGDTR